jgi:DNA-binding CsgD family transcriptional regulator
MVGLASTVLATSTVWLVGARVTELLLAQVTARAADELALGILGRVSADDFTPPYTVDSLNALGERLDPVVAPLRQAGSGVLRVNVVAVDGTVIYSDNHDARGKVVQPSEKPQLAAALGGAVGSIAYSGLSTDENVDLRATHEQAFEVYVPVVLGGAVVGAYEIYQDPAPLSAVLKMLWLLLTAAFAILLSIPVPWASARRSRASPAVSSVSLPSVAPDALAGPGTVLTPRELQVLRMMASPLSYREIASALVISEETVRTHTKHVLRKLGQPDRTNAVLSAVAGGLLQLPERPEEHGSTADDSTEESTA